MDSGLLSAIRTYGTPAGDSVGERGRRNMDSGLLSTIRAYSTPGGDAVEGRKCPTSSLRPITPAGDAAEGRGGFMTSEGPHRRGTPVGDAGEGRRGSMSSLKATEERGLLSSQTPSMTPVGDALEERGDLVSSLKASVTPMSSQRASITPAGDSVEGRGGGVCLGGAGAGWSVCVDTGLVTLTDAALATLINTDPIDKCYCLDPEPIARGQFAVVYHCTHRISGLHCVAKHSTRRRLGHDCTSDIVHEIAVSAMLRDLGNQCNTVQLQDVFSNDTEMILVMEYAPGGDLQTLLDQDLVPYERDVISFLRQLLQGLVHLHHNNLVHLDIKPQNLVLMGEFPDCNIKLCDFEICRVLSPDREVREILGTPDYVAPEIILYEPITTKTDMWSVGVLSYVLLTGFLPFGGETDQETFLEITLGELDFPEELFEDVSAEAIDFIKKLLVRKPASRMSARECLDHPWMKADLGKSKRVHTHTYTHTHTPHTHNIPQKQQQQWESAYTNSYTSTHTNTTQWPSTLALSTSTYTNTHTSTQRPSTLSLSTSTQHPSTLSTFTQRPSTLAFSTSTTTAATTSSFDTSRLLSPPSLVSALSNMVTSGGDKYTRRLDSDAYTSSEGDMYAQSSDMYKQSGGDVYTRSGSDVYTRSGIIDVYSNLCASNMNTPDTPVVLTPTGNTPSITPTVLTPLGTSPKDIGLPPVHPLTGGPPRASSSAVNSTYSSTNSLYRGGSRQSLDRARSLSKSREVLFERMQMSNLKKALSKSRERLHDGRRLGLSRSREDLWALRSFSHSEEALSVFGSRLNDDEDSIFKSCNSVYLPMLPEDRVSGGRLYKGLMDERRLYKGLSDEEDRVSGGCLYENRVSGGRLYEDQVSGGRLYRSLASIDRIDEVGVSEVGETTCCGSNRQQIIYESSFSMDDDEEEDYNHVTTRYNTNEKKSKTHDRLREGQVRVGSRSKKGGRERSGRDANVSNSQRPHSDVSQQQTPPQQTTKKVEKGKRDNPQRRRRAKKEKQKVPQQQQTTTRTSKRQQQKQQHDSVQHEATIAERSIEKTERSVEKNERSIEKSAAAPTRAASPNKRRGSVSHIEQRIQERHERQQERQERLERQQKSERRSGCGLVKLSSIGGASFMNKRNSTDDKTSISGGGAAPLANRRNSTDENTSSVITHKTKTAAKNSRRNSHRDDDKPRSVSPPKRTATAVKVNKVRCRSNSTDAATPALCNDAAYLEGVKEGFANSKRSLRRSDSHNPTPNATPNSSLESVKESTTTTNKNNNKNNNSKRLLRRSDSHDPTLDATPNATPNSSLESVKEAVSYSQRLSSSSDNNKQNSVSYNRRFSLSREKFDDRPDLLSSTRRFSQSSDTVDNRQESLLYNRRLSSSTDNNKVDSLSYTRRFSLSRDNFDDRLDTLMYSPNNRSDVFTHGTPGNVTPKASNMVNTVLDEARPEKTSEPLDEAYVSLEEPVDDGIFSRSESMDSSNTIESDHTVQAATDTSSDTIDSASFSHSFGILEALESSSSKAATQVNLKEKLLILDAQESSSSKVFNHIDLKEKLPVQIDLLKETQDLDISEEGGKAFEGEAVESSKTSFGAVNDSTTSIELSAINEEEEDERSVFARSVSTSSDVGSMMSEEVSSEVERVADKPDFTTNGTSSKTHHHDLEHSAAMTSVKCRVVTNENSNDDKTERDETNTRTHDAECSGTQSWKHRGMAGKGSVDIKNSTAVNCKRKGAAGEGRDEATSSSTKTHNAEHSRTQKNWKHRGAAGEGRDEVTPGAKTHNLENLAAVNWRHWGMAGEVTDECTTSTKIHDLENSAAVHWKHRGTVLEDADEVNSTVLNWKRKGMAGKVTDECTDLENSKAVTWNSRDKSSEVVDECTDLENSAALTWKRRGRSMSMQPSDPPPFSHLHLCRSNSFNLGMPVGSLAASPWGDVCEGAIGRALDMFKLKSTDLTTSGRSLLERRTSLSSQ